MLLEFFRKSAVSYINALTIIGKKANIFRAMYTSQVIIHYVERID